MERHTAEEICALMIRHSQELDQSVARFREFEGESEQYVQYRRIVGRLMADMFLEVLKPAFSEHPDLKPPELRG